MISFIIPAHNAAAYLERAVKSIVSHVERDVFEILIVENGSTDNTSDIAKELAVSYGSVKLLHSPKGVSNARNYGIENASGEWIAFVDADDYLLETGITAMVEDAKTAKYDFVIYGYESGEAEKRVADSISGENYDENEVEQFRVKMLENPTRYMTVWSKLFKRSLIVDNHISFDSEMRLSEDSDFTLQYSRVCKNVFVSTDKVYHYSIDNVSTMRGSCGDKVDDYVFAMERTGRKCADESKAIQDAFQKYILMHLNVALVRDVFVASSTLTYSQKLKKMKEVASEKVFADAIKSVKMRECFSFRMIPILCMKYHFYWASSMVYLLRAYMNKRRESKRG